MCFRLGIETKRESYNRRSEDVYSLQAARPAYHDNACERARESRYLCVV